MSKKSAVGILLTANLISEVNGIRVLSERKIYFSDVAEKFKDDDLKIKYEPGCTRLIAKSLNNGYHFMIREDGNVYYYLNLEKGQKHLTVNKLETAFNGAKDVMKKLDLGIEYENESICVSLYGPITKDKKNKSTIRKFGKYIGLNSFVVEEVNPEFYSIKTVPEKIPF